MPSTDLREAFKKDVLVFISVGVGLLQSRISMHLRIGYSFDNDIDFFSILTCSFIAYLIANLF